MTASERPTPTLFPWHNPDTQTMNPSHRSHFVSGCGCSPSWPNCVSGPDIRFSKSTISDITSVRDNHGRISRKQGEIVVPCRQHRCDALPFWPKLGHTHVALIYRGYHIAGVPELGTGGKAGSLDGLPLGRGKVALDRTTTGWGSGSSFPLLPR